ncbi:MAG: alpha/beta hydrolase [Solirubrobacteraceae bacterium]
MWRRARAFGIRRSPRAEPSRAFAGASVDPLRPRATYGRMPRDRDSRQLGWTGFTAHLADALAARGCDVVGLDTRAYLTSATRQAGALDPARVPADFLDLLGAAREWRPKQPVFLVGLSEGAGLSILAAADARVGQQLSGVVGLGTPDTVTLGWHFWDWTTWVTRREVEEPALPTARYLSFARPVPIAFINAASGDDIALRVERDLYARAQPPKRLALVPVRHQRPGDTGGGVAATIVVCLDWARHAGLNPEAPGRSDPQ